jgi:hypothetical protein
MELGRPLLKLPIRFDAEALAREVRALPEAAWVPHATGFPGNEAVRLVTVGGEPTDGFKGPMRPTQHLARCPCITEVMAELGGVWGRSRLMGLGAGAEVPEHVDSHYHWRTHLRVHVPVMTNPNVEFTCGGETVHMAAGECWVFDSFRWHEVHNRGTERRVHLVLDTVVTPHLWDLIDAAQSGSAGEPKFLSAGERAAEPLLFEQVNAPTVMSPWEVRCHLAFVIGEAEPHPKLEALLKRLDRFADSWASLWARFGASEGGLADYRRLVGATRSELNQLGAKEVRLRNELELPFVLDQLIFAMAIPEQPATVRARLAS